MLSRGFVTSTETTPAPPPIAERIAAGLIHHRLKALVALLVTAGALAPFSGAAMEPNNALSVWFLASDPAYQAYEAFQDQFGSDEIVAVAVHDPGGIFTAENLALIDEASERIKASDRIRGVTSLSTVLQIGWGDEDGDGESDLIIRKMFKHPPAPGAEVDEIRERVMSDPLYREHIITEDARTTLLIVQPANLKDLDAERPLVLADVREVVDEVFGAAGRETAIGGMGVMFDQLNQISNRDAERFLTISGAIIVLILAFTLRRVVAVLAALATIGIALTILVGIYGATGRQMNMVTMILPTLLMTYGIADAIHVVTHWYQERGPLEAAGLDRRAALARSIGYSLTPCFFTSVTTAAGFASLSGSSMAVIRDLGIFAALGVLIAFVVTIVVCSTLFDLFDVRAPGTAATAASDGPARGALAAIGRAVARRPGRVVAAGGLVAIVAGVGLSRLEVDTYGIQFLFPADPVHRDHTRIEETFGYYTPMEFLIETNRQDGAKRPDVLAAIDRLERSLEDEVEHVSKTVAVTSVVKRINQSFHDGEEAAYAIPTDGDAIAQELIFYDPDRQDDPQRLVDFPHYRTARLTVKVKNLSAKGWAKILSHAQEKIDAAGFPEWATVRASGYLPLYVLQADYVVESQVESFGLAFVIVFVLVGLICRSAKLAALAVIPNCLPVALVLGLMGLTGIRLDVATVVIAAVALGIAVDDTVHFLFRFRRELLENGGDHERAAEVAVRTAGAAMLGTTVTLTAGFAVMALAGIKSIVFFGALTAFTMVAALAGDLLLLPAFLVLFRPRLAA